MRKNWISKRKRDKKQRRQQQKSKNNTKPNAKQWLPAPELKQHNSGNAGVPSDSFFFFFLWACFFFFFRRPRNTPSHSLDHGGRNRFLLLYFPFFFWGRPPFCFRRPWRRFPGLVLCSIFFFFCFPSAGSETQSNSVTKWVKEKKNTVKLGTSLLWRTWKACVIRSAIKSQPHREKPARVLLCLVLAPPSWAGGNKRKTPTMERQTRSNHHK